MFIERHTNTETGPGNLQIMVQPEVWKMWFVLWAATYNMATLTTSNCITLVRSEISRAVSVQLTVHLQCYRWIITFRFKQNAPFPLTWDWMTAFQTSCLETWPQNQLPYSIHENANDRTSNGIEIILFIRPTVSDVVGRCEFYLSCTVPQSTWKWHLWRHAIAGNVPTGWTARFAQL